MRPAGLAEIDRAKNDGRWMPRTIRRKRSPSADDLKTQAESKKAKAFSKLDAGTGTLSVVQDPRQKKQETRETDKAIRRDAQQGEKIYP